MRGDDEEIPCSEFHRGVGIHFEQTPARVAIVKRAIDAVYDLSDLAALLEFADDPQNPPEARLFAAAKLRAVVQLSIDNRTTRPPIDLARINAAVPGLSKLNLRCTYYYASVLDPGPAPGDKWAERETPLD